MTWSEGEMNLQTFKDIWKRFYSLKFLTLHELWTILLSARHLYEWHKADDYDDTDDDDDDDDVFYSILF